MIDQQRENGREEDDARKDDARKDVSKKDTSKKDDPTGKPPPAGPHADPSLTNEEATPGAGTLPDPDGEPDNGGAVSS